MVRRFLLLLTLTIVLCALAVAPAPAQQPQHQHYTEADTSEPALNPTTREGHLAPRLQNLGDYHFSITTKSELAQKFFDQGLTLAYGFNHREAARAFAEVARLDRDCAMAYWGHAWVLGPNINAPMDPADEPRAHELALKAMALRDKVSERERDYIEALAPRYSGKAEDRQASDRAFAEAMRKLSEKYPEDLDAATIYAEALMDLRPWNYWTKDYKPFEETREILRLLEMVMERNPNHPGANHYYIHAVELPYPERAEAAVDRLGGLAPAAGHLVHMPAHIYIRVGRYQDAFESNVRAIAADEEYISQCRAQGIYPLLYYPHNVHFLWMAATMEGRSHVAQEAAEKVASKVTADELRQSPFLNLFAAVPLHAYVRFGQWEKILAQVQPPADQRFLTGIWHFARGMALTATGRLDAADRELAKLSPLATDKTLDELQLFSNSAGPILRVAEQVLAGELASRRGDYEKAIAHLHRGVLFDDSLVYDEPPDWPLPVRQILGAVLLEAGRPLEAEVVYWEDLRRNPENGWSLFGLLQALQAQGKDELAAEVEKRFQKAWANADVQLTASRY